MSLETPKKELRLSPSTPRKTFNDDKVLHGFVLRGLSPLFQTRRPPRRRPRTAKILSMPPTSLAPAVPHLQLCFFAIGSVFVDASTSVGTRQSKIVCLELGSRFERVLLTPVLWGTLSEVELSETPSTSRRKFWMKSLTSFNSFEKDSSSASDRTTREGAQQLGHSSRKSDR